MVQVMPQVALRIVADFEREEREISRFLRQACQLSSSFTSGLEGSANIFEEQSSSMSTCMDDDNDRICELFPKRRDFSPIWHFLGKSDGEF
jgi:hypothetical protein